MFDCLFSVFIVFCDFLNNCIQMTRLEEHDVYMSTEAVYM